VLCLLEPLLSKQRAKPGANYFVVLADNSQGMQIHDRGQPQSRGEQIKKVLGASGTWQQTLAENVPVATLLIRLAPAARH